MMEIESAGLTDVGKKRRANEDAILIDDALRLYGVADGMGGHRAGEVASSMVVDSLQGFMRGTSEASLSEFGNKPDKTLSPDANRLLSAVQKANLDVYLAAQADASRRGMGSTVSVIHFTENTVIAANVGDSPIYLIHGQRIELLSVAHTVLAEQAALYPEGSHLIGREYKHMLTRAVGVDRSVKADLSEIHSYPEDIIVIGSDGLSDKVAPDEILSLTLAKSPENACRELVQLANDRGGDDNISVVILRVKSMNGKDASFLQRLSRLKRKWGRISKKR